MREVMVDEVERVEDNEPDAICQSIRSAAREGIVNVAPCACVDEERCGDDLDAVVD